MKLIAGYNVCGFEKIVKFTRVLKQTYIFFYKNQHATAIKTLTD